MCDQLAQQLQQQESDEDQRIAKAVAEQDAEREVSHQHPDPALWCHVVLLSTSSARSVRRSSSF